MDSLTLALDVGGTKVAGALIDATGRIRYDAERPTPQSDAGADPGLTETLSLVAELVGHASAQGWRLSGVGAGFPEYVDESGQLTSREVLDWTEQPAVLLADACGGVPCVVESDVRCGAIAEWRHGAGQGHPGVFYVSLGTGLSAASIVDSQIIRGARGEAIALGEWTLPSGRSNLETYASGAGIAARYAVTTQERIEAREIAHRASEGDVCAQHVLTSAGQALGIALVDVVSLLDPPIVILGGGLGSAETPLHQALRVTYDEHVARRPKPPPLVAAALGSRAGLIGAALLAQPPLSAR